MKIHQLVWLALALAAPTPALAQERLVSPALDGFEVGYRAANGQQSILEEVPVGEDVQNWTAMVTTQWFAVAKPSLAVFAETFIGNLRRACPGATFTDPENFTQSGEPAVLFSADCPLSPATGGREQMTVLAISGNEALHVKQVAFRPGYDGDTGWAEVFLRGTRICGTDC